MSEKISRRNFLRTATLGAAAAGLLAGCGNSAARLRLPNGQVCRTRIHRSFRQFQEIH